MRSVRQHDVVASSPLRTVDARAKLALTLAASTAVMLPLAELAIFVTLFGAFLVWAGLRARVAGQLARLAPLVGLLFVLDWALVGLDHALLISLRLGLVATTFLVLSATTTAEELAEGLERLGLSPRIAFTLAAAHRALGSVDEEVQQIVEAQRARGIRVDVGERSPRANRIRRLVAFVVPAVVLVTERAWRLNEAAQVRGLESPHRVGARPARLDGRDRGLVVVSVAVPVLLAWWS